MTTTREIDALIEHALYPERTLGTQRLSSYIKNPNGYSDLRSIPYYTTNIAEAFAALNMWLDSHPTYAVSIETVNLITGRIYDVVLWGMDYEEVFAEKADTLPLAICNVLLSTLEEK